MTSRSKRALLGICIAAAACDAAEGVRVQELPPTERPSAESRAGLPEVAGVWRFAGWELARGDSAGLAADLPALGELRVQTQRLDSVAAAYVQGGTQLPLVGEVRRDSVLALAARVGGEGRFLAGRVRRDTLWVSLTSLLPRESWPADARAAFVRTQVATPFKRLEGAVPLAAAMDSTALLAAADSLRADTAAPPAGAPPAAAPLPATAPPARAPVAQPQPQQPRTETPPAQQPPAQRPPVQAQPARPQPEPARPQPTPAPQPTPPRPSLPPLLGEPIRPDTARDTTAFYSPTAARAAVRPRSVSASR